MNKRKTLSLKIDGLTLKEARAINRFVDLLRHPANDGIYTYITGEDGSCYKRVLEATPTEMLEKMPGICLLLLDQPDIVEVSIKRPSPGHPTIGVHYVEDVIKLRGNENE